MNSAPEKRGNPEQNFNRMVETLFSQEQFTVLYFTIRPAEKSRVRLIFTKTLHFRLEKTDVLWYDKEQESKKTGFQGGFRQEKLSAGRKLFFGGFLGFLFEFGGNYR